MKKFIVALSLLAMASSAMAHGVNWGYQPMYGPGVPPPPVYYGGGHHYYGGGYRGGYSSSTDVILPMIIGGAVGYAINGATRPQQPQQPVIIQQPQVQQQTLPGSVYNANEPLYQYKDGYDQECQCNRRVLVKVN